MRIIFARHGKDDERYRGGWSDLELLPSGVLQAQKMAEKIKSCDITEIIASDLPRTMQTAGIAGDALGLPVHPEPRLREINNGKLSGMLNTDALREYPGVFCAYQACSIAFTVYPCFSTASRRALSSAPAASLMRAHLFSSSISTLQPSASSALRTRLAQCWHIMHSMDILIMVIFSFLIEIYSSEVCAPPGSPISSVSVTWLVSFSPSSAPAARSSLIKSAR